MQMKTLYVSDLDGTLFNTEKALTPATVQLLNECIRRGALFAVATARMPYGCDRRLEALRLSAPSVLTNGVFLYDFEAKRYLSAETIPDEAAHRVLDVFARHNVKVFLYTFADGQIGIHYNDPALTGQTQYYSRRALESCAAVTMEPDLGAQISGGSAFYFACTGAREALEPVVSAVDALDGVSCAFYLNIYNGLYCVEVFSHRASKRNALTRLKTMLGCDELVVFGDNLNDLSMFEIADRSYAVANALDIVKERATGTIGSCNEDGVARFLKAELLSG